VEFDKLWNYGDPAATETKFRDLLPTAPDEDTRLQLLTQIARTLGLRGRFDEAHGILDGVEKEMTPDLGTVRVRYLLERGRAFNSSKQPDRARPLFLEAWELGRAAKLDDYAVDAAHMMAIVEPPERKLAWNEKAMAVAEASSEPRARGWLWALCNNIGWDYHAQGRYAESLALHEKARDWALERNPKGEQQFISRWSIARQLRALGRVEESLAAQRTLAAENDTDGFVHEELGECLLLLGREAEAKPHFRRAHEMLGKIGWVAEDKARIERLGRLGN
jgi:tetratricopeptide (TPR) repeat protein